MKYLLALLLTTGCAGSLEGSPKVGAAPPSQRCIDLDDRRALWESLGKGSAVVAGGTAVTPLIEEVRDDQGARIAVAATAGVAAAFSAFSMHLSGRAGESWSRECR